MSFNESTSGDVRDTISKQKRRINKNEISKDDKATLQGRVNNMRSQIDFVQSYDYMDNLASNPVGPSDFVLEPDDSDINAYATFDDVYGNGTLLTQSVNSVSVNAIEITDSAWTGKDLYYCVPNGSANWDWDVGFHPPSVKNGNSVKLNRGDAVNQFLYYDNFGVDFNFTTATFSLNFWIYPTSLASTGVNKIVAQYRIDNNNRWSIEIDDADKKIFASATIGGTLDRRQYDTVLAINNWYCINLTLNTTPTVSLKVNDQADIASTKAVTPSDNIGKLFFGSVPGQPDTKDYVGDIAAIIYEKNTNWTNTERTSMYNYNTTTNTTSPFVWGFGQFG